MFFIAALCFCNFFLFLQNREVLKSALSEFNIAINQAFVKLTQKLCQGVQQQEAHAEGGKAGPSTSKGTGRLGVKGRMTFWKNHSVRVGVMKKTPAAMKIMPTLTLATQRGTKMMRTTMDLEMISTHHKLTQELLRTKLMTSSIAYVSFSLFF